MIPMPSALLFLALAQQAAPTVLDQRFLPQFGVVTISAEGSRLDVRTEKDGSKTEHEFALPEGRIVEARCGPWLGEHHALVLAEAPAHPVRLCGLDPHRERVVRRAAGGDRTARRGRQRVGAHPELEEQLRPGRDHDQVGGALAAQEAARRRAAQVVGGGHHDRGRGVRLGGGERVGGPHDVDVDALVLEHARDRLRPRAVGVAGVQVRGVRPRVTAEPRRDQDQRECGDGDEYGDPVPSQPPHRGLANESSSSSSVAASSWVAGRSP